MSNQKNETMKHRQIEKTNMYRKMIVFFTNPLNAAIWATFGRLVDEIANFISLNTQLSNYMQQHQADVTGFTTTKNNAFTAMVTLVVKKAKKAYVWAVDEGNDALAQVFDVQVSDFVNGPETVAFTKIKNIRDALSANILSMASVQLTTDDVSAIIIAIAAYDNNVGVPDTAKAHKTEGTSALENLYHPIDKSLGLIDNLIDSQYSETNADMVKEYWLTRNIDKLPTRHSGVNAIITDAITGAALQGAILSVNGKTTTSDTNGIAEIIKIKPSTYKANVSLANYATQDVTIVIERGRVTELEVKMAK